MAIPRTWVDESILAALRSGREAEAFDLLVAAYRRRVHALAYSIVRDRQAAEDVAQDVFVKLWRALPRYDGRAQLSTWIYAITRNAGISALRGRRPEVSLEDPDVLAAAEVAGAERAGEARGDAAELDRTLARLVAELPERQRQVVTLYYLEERSCDEVAAMLAMPVNTVKTHLHRARAKLAAELAPVMAKEAAA
jgi:RNA polymerase sigma-70 factor (ECF subfamily)